MNRQLSFLDPPPPEVSRYSLFLAFFPDLQTARLIAEFANDVRRAHGLYGRVRPINHLHVSLLGLGLGEDVPRPVLKAIEQACQIINPFIINLSQILSFRNSPDNHPLVLAGETHENKEIKELHRLLRAMFNFRASTFVPHMTLLYDKQEIPSKPIEPIFWTAREIVLIRSEVGATRYTRLGCWQLGRGSQST